ncbi:MAG: hypothetical protein RLZZ427_1780 [Pseudomonadota bacterium]|jgi:HD-GYP domain-containing protein (c-di-GMP phosphodiesterase class II)
MLKRISPAQAELGMFVHKLEGSWLKHPFWKSRFLLEDAATLENLRHSEIEAVLIDVSKGRDIADAHPDDAPAALHGEPAGRRRIIRRTEPFDFSSTQRTSAGREFGHAQSVAKRAEKAISRVFLNARLGKAVNASEVEPVIAEIFASVQRNPHAFNGLMRCKRDHHFAYQHALAVSALMISLARTMKLPPAQIRDAGMAGLLLDVGIGHLPIDLDAVGGDYRGFDDAVLQAHTTLGYNYLQLGGDIPEAVAQAALQHHERVDGTGYPAGLRGDAISLLARMAAVCDTYDMLVTDGARTRGLDPAAAIVAMAEMPGRFDPLILAAFIEAIGAYPVGSVVRLASDQLALVIDQNPADHRLPRVRTFYAVATGQLTEPADLVLAHYFGGDRIIAQADPDAYGIEDFNRLRLQIFAAATPSAA